jgi:hypothetical protein
MLKQRQYWRVNYAVLSNIMSDGKNGKKLHVMPFLEYFTTSSVSKLY